ncbi:hypothetical protein D3C76_1474950 [compost metagenome]
MCTLCKSVFKPSVFKDLQLLGLRLFDRLRVQRLDPSQDVAHLSGLSRIGKATLLVPLGQRRRVRAHGLGGQVCTIGSQMVHHACAGGRQQAAPLPFEGRR